jgi:hypothetical protein
MIGQRMSGQATGYMASGRNTSKHKYFSKKMNSSLLPSARASINVLLEQSLKVGYTSGECLMSLYRKVNKIDTLKALNHFFNTLHLDDSCHLHKSYAKNVMSSELTNTKECQYLENVTVTF